MRSFRLLLILAGLLLPTSSAHALEFFADFLYWKATEPVDWVLHTNASPTNQFVNYQSFEYDFKPGLRVGASYEGEWDTKFYYTYFHTTTTDTAAGNLTAGFLAGKQAQPPAPIYFFDTGQAASAIDYNMFDWDFGKRFRPAEALQVRPILGIRGGWIDQTFNTALQANYSLLGIPVSQSMTEDLHNNFWGIGPKIGIENELYLWQGDELEINGIANFYTAYLLGQWSINDVAHIRTTALGIPFDNTKTIQTNNRDFGAVAFQTLVGLNLKYRACTAGIGYEINDWLNQCQIFTDATGPQNNDLLLQGLTVNVGFGY